MSGRDRWSRARVRAWYDALPWQCGFNYIPSTAVNFVEMWDGGSFDPDVVRRELGWGADIGLNSVRVVLPHAVWAVDPDGLLERFDRFLTTATDLSMTTVVSLLDDCEFSGEPATAGPQPDPVPGLHNSRAVGSPGRAIVEDEDSWPALEEYVRRVVTAFEDDPRVLTWDLYNEPGNRVLFRLDGAKEHPESLEPAALALLHRVFAVAREVDPVQPLTSAAWRTPPPGAPDDERPYDHPLDEACFALSDVISVHAYGPQSLMDEVLALANAHDRPVLCTEWMGRHAGSRIETMLPVFREQRIGSYMWGFVRGRSQTNLPWPDFLEPGHADEDEWFHDLVDDDGRPHDPAEIAVIRRELALANG